MKQIKIIGIGSGCTNILNRIIFKKQIKEKFTDCNVTFGAIDSDEQFLNSSSAEEKLLIKNEQDEGGFIGKSEEAEKVALSQENEIKTIIGNPDILIIVSTLGGATGSGVSPVVAKIAKESGILTVAVVTRPFSWEGKKRTNAANTAIEKINDYTQNCVVMSDDIILENINKHVTIKEAFAIADNEIIAKTEKIKYEYGKGFSI